MHLKVNVDMLIQEIKGYACFGEDIEVDDNIIIEKESEKNER